MNHFTWRALRRSGPDHLELAELPKQVLERIFGEVVDVFEWFVMLILRPRQALGLYRDCDSQVIGHAENVEDVVEVGNVFEDIPEADEVVVRAPDARLRDIHHVDIVYFDAFWGESFKESAARPEVEYGLGEDRSNKVPSDFADELGGP